MGSSSTFGAWVERRRRSLALAQEELAQRVAYSVVTIRKIESDDLRPSTALAQRLAEALEFPPEQQAAFIHFARNEAPEPASAVPAAPPLPSQTALSRGACQIPLPSTPLIGRAKELAAIEALLLRPAVRLFTLTGAGGTGKTRLAMEVARRAHDARMHDASHFAGGVLFGDLTALSEPALVLATIAQYLQLNGQGEEALLAAVKDALRAAVPGGARQLRTSDRRCRADRGTAGGYAEPEGTRDQPAHFTSARRSRISCPAPDSARSYAPIVAREDRVV
jgi:transcriptional regulator with XRE-family HTH domain